MKNTPYALVLCAAALLGRPLVSVAAPPVDEAKISASVLKKYDANQDGTLDETERAAWQAAREKQRAAREARRAADLARYDANHDGKLDRDERAIRKADGDKAREVRRAEEAAAAEARKLVRYDKNRNGKLDEDELAAMKADAEKRKASRAVTTPAAAPTTPAAPVAASTEKAAGPDGDADEPTPAAP